jgi:transcription termination/antitermination protein NusG
VLQQAEFAGTAHITSCPLDVNRTWDLPPHDSQPKWYAAYTCVNREKKIAIQLEQRRIEHFLPSYQSVRRWKDRRVRLAIPLFPGYVFVFLALRDRLSVLQVPGVVHLVSFNGYPAPLDPGQIDRLRAALNQLRAEPHPFLTVGRKVRVRSGPLVGADGILLRRKNSCRVVLSLELIQRSVAVEVDIADLELLLS